MKEKKQSELSILLGYAGNYKRLTFLGMFLSAVAMVMGMLPYVCIWLAARDLIQVAPNWSEARDLTKYGWMAFGCSFGGIVAHSETPPVWQCNSYRYMILGSFPVFAALAAAPV